MQAAERTETDGLHGCFAGAFSDIMQNLGGIWQSKLPCLGRARVNEFCTDMCL